MSDFGSRVRARRKELGLTLDEVSKRAGCTKAAISNYERGYAKSVTMDLLFPLAQALEVTPQWLATGKGGFETIAVRTDQEKELIATYRTLPPALQDHLVQTSVSLASSVLPSPPYPKAPPSTVIPTVAKKRR